jgi:hypothetical protein
MNLAYRYFNQKGISLFLGILLIDFLILWLSRSLLLNENVFYNTFSEQLTYERSLKLFDNMMRMSWLSYIMYPVILILKVTAISIVIYTSAFFLDLTDTVSLNAVFKVVLASEVAFLIVGFLKFFWFYFIQTDFTLHDLEFFYPVSLINLFKRSEVQKIWIYPLQTVNLFNIIYMFLLSIGLCKVSMIKRADAEKIVLTSYIPLLFLWNVLIMFMLIGNQS